MVRMWMIPPDELCRQHLLGQHNELHMILGSLKKGRSLKGHIDKNQIDPLFIYTYHDAVAKEMINRGYNHNSNIDALSLFDYLVNNYSLEDKWNLVNVTVDISKSYKDLHARCPDCKNLYNKKHNTLNVLKRFFTGKNIHHKASG